MTNLSDDRVLQLLRAALPPAAAVVPGDLWPRVHRGLDRPRQGLSMTDYGLLAGVGLVCLLRPSVLGLVLFHL